MYLPSNCQTNYSTHPAVKPWLSRYLYKASSHSVEPQGQPRVSVCCVSGWFTFIAGQGTFWSTVNEWLLVLSMQSDSASAAGQYIQFAQASAGATSKGICKHGADDVRWFICQGWGLEWYAAI